MSQLSLAIFIASGSYLGAQKCFIKHKTCPKLVNPWILVHGFGGWHDIAPKYDQRKGCLWINPFLTRLKLHKTFLSDQEVSESYKNCYRKLRVCTFRSESLVNGCWPFRQHFDSILTCTCPNKSFSHFAKSDGWSI